MNLKELIDKRVADKLEKEQSIKRVPAKVLSETADYKRADVELSNGMIQKNMLNKSNEVLDVGQGVYVEYMTMPSSGYIAMTTGECRPLGGGEPSVGIQIDNAAIITPVQASKFITDEEVIYADEEEIAKIVYGKVPNWFYIQGYPCRFVAQRSTVPTDAEATAIAQADLSLLPSEYVTMYSATRKYKFVLQLRSIDLDQSNGDWYLRYAFNGSEIRYDLQNDEWVETSRTTIWNDDNVRDRSTMLVPITIDSVYGGIVISDVPYIAGWYARTDYLNYNTTNTTQIVVYPVLVLKNASTGALTAKIGSRPFYDRTMFKTNAEVIFAQGMTATSEVIEP
jgi:hypothetical protein